MTTSEFNDSQSHFPQNVIQTSNSFKDNKQAANNGLHTHFGGREHDGGMGNLAENDQAVSENAKTPMASNISVKDEMNPLGNERQSRLEAGSRL